MAGDRTSGPAAGAGGNTSGTGGPSLAPMREGAGAAPERGDGDDRANELGGGEGGGTGNPAAAESGDIRAGRSERGGAEPGAAGAGAGADAGSPGGMGGVRGGMPNPDHRPNGGVSPIRGSDDGRR